MNLRITEMDDDQLKKAEERAKNDASLATEAKAAVEMIRKRIDTLYGPEPDPIQESLDRLSQPADHRRSKHQQFLEQLIRSGQSLPLIQAAWHEYYASLPENEKHAVWREYYDSHAKAAQYATNLGAPLARAEEVVAVAHAQPARPQRRAAWQHQLRRAGAAAKQTLKPDSARRPAHSLLFGLGVGAIVLIIFLFGFFNERFIAPFIQPSRTIASTPIIGDNSTVGGPNPEIIIPKINLEVPVVYGVSSIDEQTVQNALEGGVLHYADTALPGEDGNVVIIGHSSNNIFNKGKYKFAFVLLAKLETGDTFALQKNGKRVVYRVFAKEIVNPNQVDILKPPAGKTATASLITCDPPGTSASRLVVIGEQIAPAVAGNTPERTTNIVAATAKVIPGNAPSLWSKLSHWLSN